MQTNLFGGNQAPFGAQQTRPGGSLFQNTAQTGASPNLFTGTTASQSSLFQSTQSLFSNPNPTQQPGLFNQPQMTTGGSSLFNPTQTSQPGLFNSSQTAQNPVNSMFSQPQGSMFASQQPGPGWGLPGQGQSQTQLRTDIFENPDA